MHHGKHLEGERDGLEEVHVQAEGYRQNFEHVQKLSRQSDSQDRTKMSQVHSKAIGVVCRRGQERKKILGLLNWMEESKKHTGSVKRIILWSDEKLFTVDPVWNCQNDRQFMPANNANGNDCIVTWVKDPQSVMTFGLIASDGNIMPPIFLPTGAKVTAAFYQEHILSQIKVWLERIYGGGSRNKVVLMQDGTPTHTAATIQAYLATNWGLDAFWAKEMWPPSSPELNPLDFWVWGIVEAKACKKRASNVQQLRGKVTKVWDTILTPEAAKKACNSVKERLEKCVAAKGKIFMFSYVYNESTIYSIWKLLQRKI